MAKIGIDARLTYYTQGGIAQYTQQLIREMASLQSPHQFYILHSRKDKRDLASGENQHKVSCWTPAHHRFERAALALELLPRNLDLLHSPDFIPPRTGSYRSVITIPDLAFLRYPDFLTAESHHYYSRQIMGAVAQADHIIAISDATRNDVIAYLSAHPDKVTTIHLAVDPRFKPASDNEIQAAHQKYGLPGSYILFLSTIEPRKNVSGLLRAYDLLKKNMPDAPALVIAGKRGWFYDNIFKLYRTLNLENSVTWLHELEADDLPALYSGASVFCLPSHYEGFGIPPLEAMACGTPVVVSDRASLPEVVGEAGEYVNPDDPESIAHGLQRVLSDTDLVERMRTEGFKQASRFSWTENAMRTLAIYEQVLAL